MKLLSNYMSLKATNQLKKNNKIVKNKMEKLSSGNRINKAADDAAGMAISQKMRSQLNGLQQSQKNIQDSVSLYQTAEGGMSEIQGIIHRMRELTIQGANDTLNKNDKENIQAELDQLKKEIETIAQETEFNGMPVIDGTFSQKSEDVEGYTDKNSNVPDDGSTITKTVEVGDFNVDFNFTKISESKVKVEVMHQEKLLGTKTITKEPLKWEKNLGGNLLDSAQDITKTSDGGYMLVGRSESTDGDLSSEKSTNDSDLWAVKLDSSRNIEWQQTIGANGFDEGATVEETSSGDFVISGTETSADGDKDISAIKLNQNGTVNWDKSFGGGDDSSNIVHPTNDGGYILAGATTSNNGDKDILTMKVDSDGQYLWEKQLGTDAFNDKAIDITQDSSGNYAIATQKDNDAVLYQLDSSGSINFEKNYNGFKAKSVQKISTGYVLAGDNRIIKSDDSGNKTGEKDLSSLNFNRIENVQQDSDGNYIVSGRTTSNNGDTDFAAAKLDSSFNKIWSTNDKGFGSTGDEGSQITVTADGGYLVTDPSDATKDNLVMRFNETGVYQWETKVANNDDTINKVTATDNGYLLTGDSSSNNKNWIAKLNNDGSIATGRKDITGTENVNQIDDVKKLSTGDYAVAGTKDDGDQDFWVSKLNNDLSQQWANSYGGSNADTLNSISEVDSGKLVAVGNTTSNDGNVSNNYGGSDAWAVGLDSNGDLSWDKNLGGSNTDLANTIKSTSDGGYILTGSTKSDDQDLSSTSKDDNDKDGWIVKLDSSQNLEWQNLYDTTDVDRANNVEETTNGYIVSGTTSNGFNDTWVKNLDDDGTENWTNTYDGDFNSAPEMTETSTGDYILSGVDENNDLKMMKISNDGFKSWDRNLSSKTDWASSIKETTDGGYILSGTKEYLDGNQHGVVVKLSNDGDINWEQDIGTTGNDSTTNIEEDSAGNYIVSGSENNQLWVDKLNSDGSQIWSQNYNGLEATSIKEDDNGDYVISGTKTSINGDNDMTILKVNSNDGSQIWQQDFGGGNDSGANIQPTNDGGYILSGTKKSNDGDKDSLIMKLDNNGNVEWQEELKDNGLAETDVNIQQTNDNGYILSATKETSDGDTDIWTRKLDTSGNQVWENTYGSNLDETSQKIQQTSDGGYVIAGGQMTSANGEDASLLKLAADGSVDWQKNITGSSDERANDIQQTADGGYIVAGYTSSNDISNTSTHNGGEDAMLTKIDSSGNIVWTDLLGGSGDDQANSVQEVMEGNYIIGANSNSNDGDVVETDGSYSGQDMWMAKYSKGISNISINPAQEAQKRTEYGHGTKSLDLTDVGIEFDWKDFEVKEIDAQGEQRTEASYVVHDGPNKNDKMWSKINNVTTKELDLKDWPSILPPPENAAQKSMKKLKEANQKVSEARAKIGAYENRLNHVSNRVANYQSNLTTSKSRIKDADMAQEMTDLSRSQILAKSSQAILAQIQNMPSNIMQLMEQGI
ncbi:MAG: flagellin [Bacillota bacterium]